MSEKKQKKQTGQKKHAPQRTCIGCRAVAGKRGLIRVVRTANDVVVDESGKMAGRGAYIHPTRACWDMVLSGNRISQALRTPLSAENRAQLQAFAESLPEDQSDTKATVDS